LERRAVWGVYSAVSVS